MSNTKIQNLISEGSRDAAMRQSEAQRYFSARGSRTTAARARSLLMRIGAPEVLRDDDRLDATDDEESRPGQV